MADDDLAAAAAAMLKLNNKSPWTVGEDRVLVDYVAANGAGSWNYLARAAGLNRTGKSCRLRWRNYLRPDLRREEMTAEEIDVIVRLHSQWGNKWCKIAKQLPGRTENQVMNFWRTNIQHQNQKKTTRRRQHDKVVDDITAAAGLCTSGVDNTPASTTTEGQGSSSRPAATTTTPGPPPGAAGRRRRRRLGSAWWLCLCLTSSSRACVVVTSAWRSQATSESLSSLEEQHRHLELLSLRSWPRRANSWISGRRRPRVLVLQVLVLVLATTTASSKQDAGPPVFL